MTFSTRILLTLGALISVAGGCSQTTQPNPRTAVVQVNTAPKATAGPDVWVQLPTNSWVLNGSATDAESNIDSYSWKKISGPGLYSIESPQSKQTRVSDLEVGTYEFEFTVIDKGSLAGRDTVRVRVSEPGIAGANELIFQGLQWQCPMGCTLTIENFRGYVPDNAAMRVFLNTGDASAWIEVKPNTKWTEGDTYFYQVHSNYLSIYTDDESGTRDVKVDFLGSELYEMPG